MARRRSLLRQSWRATPGSGERPGQTEVPQGPARLERPARPAPLVRTERLETPGPQVTRAPPEPTDRPGRLVRLGVTLHRVPLVRPALTEEQAQPALTERLALTDAGVTPV